MLHASTQQLIRKLHELTEAGGLAWKEGERETSRLETEGYIVEIEATPPGLRLLRGDGRELEKASADDLGAVAWPGGEGTYATRVAEMAARAHRIARGAEQAIATILSSLSAPAKNPVPPAPQPAAPRPIAAAPIDPPKPPAAAPVAQAAKPPAPAPAQPPAGFGQTASFARPEPAPPAVQQKPADPAPPPAPKKPAPEALIQGISARTVQHVEQSLPADLQRLTPPKPALQPVVPNPAPRAPAATGPNVYKPWS